jgi:hypothetical protein
MDTIDAPCVDGQDRHCRRASRDSDRRTFLLGGLGSPHLGALTKLGEICGKRGDPAFIVMSGSYLLWQPGFRERAFAIGIRRPNRVGQRIDSHVLRRCVGARLTHGRHGIPGCIDPEDLWADLESLLQQPGFPYAIFDSRWRSTLFAPSQSCANARAQCRMMSASPKSADSPSDILRLPKRPWRVRIPHSSWLRKSIATSSPLFEPDARITQYLPLITIHRTREALRLRQRAWAALTVRRPSTRLRPNTYPGSWTGASWNLSVSEVEQLPTPHQPTVGAPITADRVY